MPRLHLVELEDLPWWPRVVRDLATEYLHFMESRFELHRPVVSLLAEALRQSGTQRVVDLCSGGSGPIPALIADLSAAGISASAVLTDRYPNVSAFERVASHSKGTIIYEREPVDALN